MAAAGADLLLRHGARVSSVRALQGTEGPEGYLMFTDREKWQAAMRELGLRLRVYPSFVKSGRCALLPSTIAR